MRILGTSRTRLRILALLPLLGGLVLPLAACSRHTALTVRADLAPFMTASEKQATLSYAFGPYDIKLPASTTTPNPGELIDLTQIGVPASATSVVDAFALDLAGTVTPTTDLPAGSAGIYVAPSNATDAFQASYRVATVATPSLTANHSATVTARVHLDSQSDPNALKRIQSGAFRLGVEVSGNASNAGSADVTLTKMLVSVTLPPGWGLP